MMNNTDNLTPEQRRKAMQAVKSKNTSIETPLCKALWQKGYRYRKNYKKILGKPDIVFMSLKIAVFCDSEFWHGHDWENRKHDFKSKQAYWFTKIERNIMRDKKVTEQLQQDGWIVIRFWGKQIAKELENCVEIVETAIRFRKNSF
jgi:DNA mismatch endonuclease Vsr